MTGRSCSKPTRRDGCPTRWHTFTPEWGAAYDIDEGLRARIAAERRSRVSFELEPDGPLVKLTVVHDDFDEGSTVAEMVSGGWPRVVGELKSLLEAEGSDAEGFGVQMAGAASVADVVADLTTLDGLASWWTPDVTGSPAPGGELTFRFRGGLPTVMRVEHVDPTGLVVWTCTACGTFADWVGTSLWFDRAAAPRRRVRARLPARRAHPRTGVLRDVRPAVGASPGEPGRDRDRVDVG